MHCGIGALDNPSGLHLTIVGYRTIGCASFFEEGRPHFLFANGEELEKNTSTFEEALFHEDGSPKGSQAISRNWTARFRAVPWDVAIPLLFVRAVEIISNEITDRNNGIEKLEKKSFFFFSRG